MGFTLRFIVGFSLVLVTCPTGSQSASTWRRMKLLSQDPSTLEPIDKNGEILNTNSSDEERERQKPKTDETNKLKEESIDTLDRPLSVTQNDLGRDSLESLGEIQQKPVDIDKYLSPEFHDKNNVYKLATSPDIKKYVDIGDTTLPYDFDKKFETIEFGINKKLEYIDEQFPKSTHHYEATTNHELTHSAPVKYTNTTFIGKNGLKTYKDEQVESGQKLDYGSSYVHTVADEQKHTSSSESFLDANPKINETDDSKNKAFRTKTTVDPEVLHEKLNQTERRTALLSNKIELDSTENRRTKWSFHYAPTTLPYTTTTGEKEEIMFVPYTKESPINISKRGSTRFIDTIRKQSKALDEAALENQIYPVQVPAPNNVSKEETIQNVSVTTPTINATALPEVTTVHLTTFDNFAGPSTPDTEDSTITSEISVIDDGNSTVDSGNVTVAEENSTVVGENVTVTAENVIASAENVTAFTENVSASAEDVTVSTEKANCSTEKSTVLTENTTVGVDSEGTTLTSNSSTHLASTSSISEENSTAPAVKTTSTDVISTKGDFVSDPTTVTVVPSNDTVTTTSKETEMTEISTPVFDTTLDTSSSLHVSTISTQDTAVKHTTPLKIEDRTNSARDLKNLTTLPELPSTTIEFGTESPTEPTTVNDNDNVIKQSDVITSTTDHIRVPVKPTYPPYVERKQRPDFQTPSEPNTNEDNLENGYTRSEEEEEGSNGGKIAAIVISCIGAVCFIVLAILLFVMRKRHKRFNYGQRCTPVSLDAYSVDNVSTYNSVRRKGMMRASKRSYGNPAFEESSVTHLLNFPELMKFGANNEEIASEYDDIPQISVQTNELPEGCETKNRYANVIPLPESRVYLSSIDECPNSDYINANYITGPKSTKNYYIACQAPMQSTVDDFWRMIWEQQSRVVLMLTHLFENGAEKCFDYLPPSEVLDCHRLFGDFQITLKKREVKEKYVISNLQLKNMVSNTWREVTHLWYLGWPERGIPVEESSLVAFLIEARSYAKAGSSENGVLKESTTMHGNNGTSSDHSPVVVHCSPGTGRTGTVIACDIAIREFELTRQVDIPKTVYQIRRNRAGAIQTKEQYAYIYRVITWYANKLTGGVLDSL